MSSLLNMLGLQDDGGFNLVIILPVAVVIVVVAFLLKLSVRKPEVTKKSQSQPQSVKKQQKVTTNKQKEEKVHSDKKEKKIKEKNVSSSPTKTSDGTASDAAKIKPNKKQTIASDKSPKKNVQTKKQQVNTKNVNKSAKNAPAKSQTNNKKQLESFVSKEEDGEWQMVTTKKQKQQKPEEIVEATTPTKSNKKSQKTPVKANKVNKTNKVKVTNETNDTPKPIVNGEVKPAEIVQVAKSEPSVQVQANEIPIFTTNPSIQHESPVPEALTSNKGASINNAEVTSTSTAPSLPSANVAFDELGDDGWTDSKPQKKNRRKALRE